MLVLFARRRRPRALVLGLAVLLGVLGLPAAVVDADALIEAEPAPGETIGEEPEIILLRFDEDLALEADANRIAVIDAEGRRVDDGKAEITGYSQRAMLVRLAEAVTEGEFMVAWAVRFAASGEREQGAFDFAVELGAEPEGPEAALEPEAPRSGQSIVLWTVVVMAAIALFALLLFHLRVATGTAESSLEDPSEHGY